MKVYPVPTIQITNKDLVANAGYPVKLETTSSPDVIRWKWGPVTGLDNPYVAEPTLTPGKSGTYTVVATIEGGCTSSDQLTIAVLCDGRNIFIPNTFSPNNDGMNDRFYPHGKGILTIRSMQIFNRWGQIVFEKVNFAANLYSEGWDGTFKGQPQGVDVYVYMMEVVCDNGTLNKINGNVTLLR
jgi:gliding motility-associated-like protein